LTLCQGVRLVRLSCRLLRVHQRLRGPRTGIRLRPCCGCFMESWCRTRTVPIVTQAVRSMSSPCPGPRRRAVGPHGLVRDGSPRPSCAAIHGRGVPSSPRGEGHVAPP
jgi:hypothetical protein